MGLPFASQLQVVCGLVRGLGLMCCLALQGVEQKESA
jgi:hypothetical protein